MEHEPEPGIRTHFAQEPGLTPARMGKHEIGPEPTGLELRRNERALQVAMNGSFIALQVAMGCAGHGRRRRVRAKPNLRMQAGGLCQIAGLAIGNDPVQWIGSEMGGTMTELRLEIPVQKKTIHCCVRLLGRVMVAGENVGAGGTANMALLLNSKLDALGVGKQGTGRGLCSRS